MAVLQAFVRTLTTLFSFARAAQRRGLRVLFLMKDYLNGCKGKQKHRSQGKADAHARHLNRIRTKTYHSYFCTFCFQRDSQETWHVGELRE